jgi:hypothetical protein
MRSSSFCCLVSFCIITLNVVGSSSPGRVQKVLVEISWHMKDERRKLKWSRVLVVPTPSTRRAFPAFVARTTGILLDDPYTRSRLFHNAITLRVFIPDLSGFLPEFATGGVAIDSTRAIGAKVPGVHFAGTSLFLSVQLFCLRLNLNVQRNRSFFDLSK